ncbi:hypothetical protein, partial [Rhodanobacter denitrificans]|uniref:hypothetical protein n=1 Tax=Rhodanobacter denitrificans TaxID=666685 RepID=UPI001EE67EB5
NFPGQYWAEVEKGVSDNVVAAAVALGLSRASYFYDRREDLPVCVPGSLVSAGLLRDSRLLPAQQG